VSLSYDLDYVDLMEDNNVQRVKARIAHRKRVTSLSPARASAEGARRPRSLPTGNVPSWVGFALSLLILAALALLLGLVVIVWLCWRLFSAPFSRRKAG